MVCCTRGLSENFINLLRVCAWRMQCIGNLWKLGQWFEGTVFYITFSCVFSLETVCDIALLRRILRQWTSLKWIMCSWYPPDNYNRQSKIFLLSVKLGIFKFQEFLIGCVKTISMILNSIGKIAKGMGKILVLLK